MTGNMIRSLRPRQWYKNLVVFLALGFVSRPLGAEAIGKVLLAFVLFCFLSSAGYILNDLVDVERDRRHPNNRFRPLASGTIGPAPAVIEAFFLVIVVAAAGVFLLNPWFLCLCGIYVLLTALYNGFLRSVPVLDLGAISGGFVIRAFIGAVVISAPITIWFGPLIFFSAMMLVAGKRVYESSCPEYDSLYRSTLNWYRNKGAEKSLKGSAACLMLAYAAYLAFHFGTPGWIWALLSSLPLIFGVLEFSARALKDGGRSPESWIFRDPALWGAFMAWAVLFRISRMGA